MSRGLRYAVALVCALPALAGCASLSPASAVQADSGSGSGSGAVALYATASTSAWGSIVSQLGGARVRTTSIISSPSTDPHDYEPTPADGRLIGVSRLFVLNGAGYDSWAGKALDADPQPSRRIIDVGSLVGALDGSNPHLWYSPAVVDKVADQVSADLSALDPAGAAYFKARHTSFEQVGLRAYHAAIARIKSRYAGTKVGASESVFSPLASALGLDVVTPPSFLRAVSEGADPSAADKTLVDQQIRTRAIRVYVVNTQNSTPDVAAQVQAARAAGIPVVAVTETLSPQGATFEQWQTAQLEALERALAAGARGAT